MITILGSLRDDEDEDEDAPAESDMLALRNEMLGCIQEGESVIECNGTTLR